METANTVPQIKSTTVTNKGQSFKTQSAHDRTFLLQLPAKPYRLQKRPAAQ